MHWPMNTLTAFSYLLAVLTAAAHISLRSGMFEHLKVVPITAVKPDSKQQSKQQPIPPMRTRTVTRTAIRHMLAAAYGRRETQLLEEKRQRAACSARRRGKILFMPERSCDDSCKHIAPHFALQQQKYANERTPDSCEGASLLCF
jgi:hypothetical protein